MTDTPSSLRRIAVALPVPATAGAAGRTTFWPVTILLLSLLLPFFFSIGPLLMTADRMVLLVAVVPCVLIWVCGQAGPIRIADIALLLMWAWITLSTLVLEGVSVTIEASGINFIETMGAYLLARCFIRDAEGFEAMVRLLFRILVILLPFALYETVTGHNSLLEIANRIWLADDDVLKEPRWGFDRVSAVFSHPILYGIFCSSGFALVYYVLGYNVSRTIRSLKAGLVAGMTLVSFSSGPVTALFAQVMLVGWDRALAAFRNRWVVLTGGVLLLVVALELAANRSVPQLFIDFFAFDKSTAYNRLRIWDFGTLSVANHPLFGIGRGDWERPEWMSSSMDMFWLVPAVRSGLPAALLLQLAFFSLFLTIAFKPGLSDRAARYRTGILICMVSFYLGGWTVDYWKKIYVLFMFLLGSGAWLLDAAATAAPAAADQPGPAPERPGPHYSRPRVSLGPATARRGPRPRRAPRTSGRDVSAHSRRER